MNDVLPKPFTKEGLLTMLEKHLGHLKANKDSDAAAPPAATRPGMKEESSSIKSPVTNSWQSPSHMPGVSPTTHSMNDEYLNALRGTQPFSMNGAMQHPDGLAFHGANPSMGAPRQGSSGHRRQISDISTEEDPAGDAKRARIFAPSLGSGNNMAAMQRVRPGV